MHTNLIARGIAPGAIEQFIQDNSEIVLEGRGNSNLGPILFGFGLLLITVAAAKIYFGLDLTRVVYSPIVLAMLSIVPSARGAFADHF